MNTYYNQKPDIIIVDDNLIFRQGLKAIINYENVGSVIGEASTGVDFLELISTLKPDFVLMDIDMPQMNGFEAAKKALEILPDLKILIFTVFFDVEYYHKMINIGAKGFIQKSSGFNELENAIKIIMNGECYFPNKIMKVINDDFDKNEMIENKINNIDSPKGIQKMHFFPWIINRRNCVIA